jgi:putative transposase
MLKAFKYKLNPTRAQAELIRKHIGSVRFVYNLALETKQTAYAGNKVNLSCFALSKQLPDLKKECPWLKEINAQSLQQAVIDLDSAYTNFFKGHAQFPKYKSKNGQKQSFRIMQYFSIDIENNKLIIPKFQEGIDIILHRLYKGNIKQCTVSKTPTDKYFVSILIDTKTELPPKPKITEENTIGVDLGIHNFLVTSNGEIVNNPNHLKNSLSRLKYIQGKYSTYKGKRIKHRLALLHERVANQRKDFLHKASTKLIRENQTICLEDLNIVGMSKRCKPKQDENGNYLPNGQTPKSGLNRSIGDVGWGMFVDMLKYKADWYGNNIVRIGRFDPSSKTCSICGNINRELKQGDREWTCAKCGTHHDRDANAAQNIKAFALKNKLCVGRTLENRKELPTLVGALTCEIER